MDRVWRCRDRELALGAQTLVMGIVNVTPDSFSDGGMFEDADAAVRHGLRLLEEGADLLDVGGESTRPGAREVPLYSDLLLHDMGRALQIEQVGRAAQDRGVQLPPPPQRHARS